MDAQTPGGASPYSPAFPRGTRPARNDAGYRALGAGLRNKHIAVVDIDAGVTGILARACTKLGGRTTVWPDYGVIGALPGDCHGLIAGGATSVLARIFSLVDIADARRDAVHPQIVVIHRLTDGRLGDAADAKARWMAWPVHEDYVLAALSATLARDARS